MPRLVPDHLGEKDFTRYCGNQSVLKFKVMDLV